MARIMVVEDDKVTVEIIHIHIKERRLSDNCGRKPVSGIRTCKRRKTRFDFNGYDAAGNGWSKSY